MAITKDRPHPLPEALAFAGGRLVRFTVAGWLLLLALLVLQSIGALH